MQTGRYGSWRSPITADAIVAGSIGIGQVALDGDDVYWSEMRPAEGGRYVIVRRTADGAMSEVTPAPYNARTRVHEYGGGAFAVHDGTMYFSNFADQRLYCIETGGDARPITPSGAWRYADGVVDAARGRMICVREDHTAPGAMPDNAVVSIDLGSGGARIIAEGNDFYSSPRLSADGARLAWLTWDHPNMPWDGTELWVADVAGDGAISNAQRVAGGSAESIVQPEWSADGALHFVSDRSGWWNLYRLRDGAIEPLCEMEAEFGRPQWVFGISTYGFASGGRIVCTYTGSSGGRLALFDAATGTLTEIETPYTSFAEVRAAGDRAVVVSASGVVAPRVVEIDLASKEQRVLKLASSIEIDGAYVSPPEPIEFPTENRLTAHALYYRPKNGDFTAPDGERPPLIVKSHGGPTAAASGALSLSIQYWTSRGFAVLDVDYGGSTGYGRAYRERLNGMWGVVDVEDCVNGARFLVERGEVDGGRLAITGGSAGGYTTLQALTQTDVFGAGASHFGVSDAEALARDTHKFESRYLDNLIGPYPERMDLYRERSPIRHADRLSCPVIFFQGLEDAIVPPAQAETMVDALKRKGLPVAYVAFEGEQHGFRRAENIKRALEGELYFYGRIFGFAPADAIEPVPIANVEP